MGSFAVHPSPALVKFWQGIVETLLRVLCLILTVVLFIAAIANVTALSSRETEIDLIESLRFQTRSPSGWLMLVTIIALPLDLFILVLRFLNVSIIIDYLKIALAIDIVIKAFIALSYFGGGIALAVHSRDWRFWQGRGTPEDISMYNVTGIVTSTSAAAAFALLASFVYIGLAVWLVLFIVFNWDNNMTKYSPEFEVKVTKVGNPETDVVIEDKPPEDIRPQLKF